ncbi:MAG: hypothetical protein V4750_02750 [Pseudomonadota bacterium]
MTSAYDIVYPKEGRIAFDGGLDNKFERSLIPDNESPDCYNVVFSNGAVGTRPGTSKLNTTAVGSFIIDGLYTRHANTGSETMIVFAGGSAWDLTGNSTFATIGSAQSVFTAGVRVAASEQENHLFSCNGYVTPYKWNGLAWTRHGVPIATGAVSVNCSAAGSRSGTTGLVYKVTFVNSASVEGDVGTATVTYTTANSKTIRLTAIPVAPQSHGVASRRIYLSTDAGVNFGRLTTIADNTTTVFDDDGTLTPSTAAPTDNGEPPKYSVICQHQGRLFVNDAANPNYVWYSEVLSPYTFASVNFEAFGDKSLDLVRGMKVYNNGILIQGDASLYLWYMPSTTPTDWIVIKIVSPYGSKSPFGGFLYENKLMVPALQSGKFVGFAAIEGSSVDPVATVLENSRATGDMKSDRIEPDMFLVQEAYVANIASMVFKQKAYIALTYGANQTTNNRVYLYDFSRSNISKSQEAAWAPITGLAASMFTVYGGSLYYGSATATGFVHQLETSTYVDVSTAINSYFWTKEFSGRKGHESYQKDFRYVKLLVDMAGAYMMNITFRTDSDSGDGITEQISLDAGAMTWNAATWGVAIWGGGDTQREITVPLGVTGKRIQFKFSNQNTANQRFKVHGMVLNYNIKGKR